MIELYPAIDLLGGEVVRLRQGAYDDATVYAGDPTEVARSFVDEGARWVHIVDLDAARSGHPVNRAVVERIVNALDGSARVQVGGGVRDVAAAAALAAIGASRVVVGSAAVAHPEIVSEIVAATGGGIEVAVGLDHRDGRVATHGWTQDSGVALGEMLGRFPRAAAFIITDISRDGMLSGPDVDGLRRCASSTSVPVIASGGVGSLEHLRTLCGVPGLGGVITGKALYERRFTVTDAIEVLAEVGT